MVSDRAANISGSTASVIDAFVEPSPNSFTHEKLHIDVSGDPSTPPVVLLHGWGSSAKLMGPVAAALSPSYFVHNIDLPGHGLSPLPPVPCGLEAQAVLVESYIRDTFSGPVVLFGHSNGGRIGLYLASQPDSAGMISKLVLVSPSGIRPTRGLSYYLKSTTARVLKFPARFLRGKLREAVLDWLTHSLVWKLLGSSDYNALTGTMRESFVATVGFFVDDMIAAIKAPTLIFWGDKDTAVSEKQIRTIESRIPDCGVVVLNGAGHYGYLDQPGVVFAATRYFLEPDSGDYSDVAEVPALLPEEVGETPNRSEPNEHDANGQESRSVESESETEEQITATKPTNGGPVTMEPDATTSAAKGAITKKSTTKEARAKEAISKEASPKKSTTKEASAKKSRTKEPSAKKSSTKEPSAKKASAKKSNTNAAKGSTQSTRKGTRKRAKASASVPTLAATSQNAQEAASHEEPTSHQEPTPREEPTSQERPTSHEGHESTKMKGTNKTSGGRKNPKSKRRRKKANKSDNSGGGTSNK